MREIKFRAWIPEKDSFNEAGMYGPFTFKDIENGHDEANVWCHEGPHIQEPKWDKIILMQFTGLKDKSGKEIYEGDVIKTGSGEIAEVKFGCFRTSAGLGCDAAFFLRVKLTNCFDERCFQDWSQSWYEVIGDIYSTPSLLKDTQI